MVARGAVDWPGNCRPGSDAPGSRSGFWRRPNSAQLTRLEVSITLAPPTLPPHIALQQHTWTPGLAKVAARP